MLLLKDREDFIRIEHVRTSPLEYLLKLGLGLFGLFMFVFFLFLGYEIAKMGHGNPEGWLFWIFATPLSFMAMLPFFHMHTLRWGVEFDLVDNQVRTFSGRFGNKREEWRSLDGATHLAFISKGYEAELNIFLKEGDYLNISEGKYQKIDKIAGILSSRVQVELVRFD